MAITRRPERASRGSAKSRICTRYPVLVFSTEALGNFAACKNRSTESVRRFLQAAKFPKASVEKTNTGYRVQIRDLAEPRDARSGLRVMAIAETDPNGKVLTDELAWDQKKLSVIF